MNTPTQRLASLDVLRGAVLFLLVFLQPVVCAWLAPSTSAVALAVCHQLDHAAWQGFRFWDLVMPLFLFMSGTSLPFSLGKQRAQGMTVPQMEERDRGLMELFVEFGALRQLPPEGAEAQAQAARLQAYLTDHYYTCTKPILNGLGQMYAAGGKMTENIDAAGGPGTGAFVQKVLELYCAE